MSDNLEPLASGDDLATLLDVPVTDGKLLLALRRASDRFRGAVRHPVSLIVDDVVLLDGDGSQALILPAAPVIGTPTVKVADVLVTDFSVSSRHGVLRRKAGWSDDLGNIEVTYTHGYENIPGDIQDAVLEQAELQFQILAGVTQMSLGSQSVAFGTKATVGVTQRWSDAVETHRLNRADRS